MVVISRIVMISVCLKTIGICFRMFPCWIDLSSTCVLEGRVCTIVGPWLGFFQEPLSHSTRLVTLSVTLPQLESLVDSMDDHRSRTTYSTHTH